jgi:hypothetical protein
MPLVLALAVGAVWLLAVRADRAPAEAAAQTAAPSAGMQFFSRVDSGGPPREARERHYQMLLRRYQRAEQSFCNYREGSKYPSGSRPIAQNPDQIYPNRPVTELGPMHNASGDVNRDIRVQTSQTRVYLAAGESVAFSLRTVDAHGSAVPVVVTRAVAQGVTFRGQRSAAQVALAFSDDGTGGDPVANDGTLVGVLNPSQTGLAGFNGTIAVAVEYNAGGHDGVVQFEVVYSPELPATWAGDVREAQLDGSLVFILPVSVRKPGRYVISGRVDDARGRPFALATFNDLLGPGTAEVRLAVFGKLMHDGAPAMPLMLRDVDGYLLKEDADPDRELMPRLEGQVHVSRVYALQGFSDAEWQSEERTRYLDEFAKDLRAARSELAGFDPALPLPAAACDSPPPPH